MTDVPAYLRPFVLPVAQTPEVRTERVGEVDLYRPPGQARRGAILFVHGGPGPVGLEVMPRDWPVYRGYATVAAQHGLVGALAAHSLIGGFHHLTAASDDVEAAVGVLRADPQVDPNRIALWFFSGSGLLAGEWLDSRPEWLRAVLLSYPMIATPPGVDELVSAAEVIGKHKDLPVLLTRVGREREQLAGPVAEFVSAGGAALDIIDVPKGQHGFDMLDHTDESRAAVTKALDWAIAHLGEDPTSTPPSTSPTRTASEKPAAPTRSTGERTTRGASTSRSRRASTASSAQVPETPAEVQSAFTDAAVVPAEPAFAGTTLTAPASEPTTVSAPPVAEPATFTTPAPAVEPSAALVAPTSAATLVVDRERAAYVAHDLEGFLATYSPTAQLQLADGSLLKGRRSLREFYRPRFEAGQCKAELRQRMTLGDWVVDHVALQDADRGLAAAIVLYKVVDHQIAEVRILG